MRFLRQLWFVIAALVAAFALSWFVYMPSSAERGVWRAQTGGTIITLTPFTAQMYSETAVSCLHQLSFPAHLKLVELTEGATVEAGGKLAVMSSGAGGAAPAPAASAPAAATAPASAGVTRGFDVVRSITARSPLSTFEYECLPGNVGKPGSTAYFTKSHSSGGL